MYTTESFTEALAAQGEYRISEVRLEISEGLAVFHPTLTGPGGAQVWARAWLSDEDGTLSETATEALVSGAQPAIAVRLPEHMQAHHDYLAVIRIESAPLQTEHVLSKKLRLSKGRLVGDKP